MSDNRRNTTTWTPMAIAVAMVVGIVVGAIVGNPFASSRGDSDRKPNTVLNLISQEYVDDSIKIDDLVEMSIPAILSNLDPHSTYLSARDLQAANEELNGSFSGIGISFQVLDDTVTVMEVIPGGPSDKVGLLPGDKIVTVEGAPFVGDNVDANRVREKLRGDKNTKVKVGIKRANSEDILNYTITRGDVPVNSVDAA